MKKTIITLLALGCFPISAATIAPDIDYSNPAKWVYVWDGESTGNVNDGNGWSYLTSSTESELQKNSNNKPTSSDVAFIGYTFDGIVDGKQTFTSTSDPVTLTLHENTMWKNQSVTVYLGDAATLNLEVYNDYGAMTFHLGSSSVVNLDSSHDAGFANGARVDYGTITGNNLFNAGRLW